MKIKILTFGIARDITGSEFVEVELPEGTCVADLQNEMKTRYPAFKRLSSLMVAVNTAYATDQTILNENDEVALIPPVSGG